MRFTHKFLLYNGSQHTVFQLNQCSWASISVQINSFTGNRIQTCFILHEALVVAVKKTEAPQNKSYTITLLNFTVYSPRIETYSALMFMSKKYFDGLEFCP